MTQIWSFSGGIHPPENKHQSTTRPIRNAGIPQELVLPLQQHIGEPAELLVTPGDHVLKGQKLADITAGLGVPLHAPTSGLIDRVELRAVPHPSGMSDWCVVLRPDGDDRWCDRQPIADYRSMNREQLLDLIRDAGIAGMGGAGFPTNIKLRPSKDRKVDILILNGAECEPYITADDMTMREKADEVIAGLKIMAWILRPGRVVVAIEDNKPEAIAAMQQAAAGTQTEILTIPTRYPSGGEKQLIRIVTGMEVPHGGIPADIGVMCQNIGTAVAVGRAIHQGEPLISRVTTITGEAVAEAGNFDVLLGTPVRYLLENAGYEPERASRLVLGGPMMGYTLETSDVPVTKTTNCVIAASAQELPAPPPEQPCIRCGQCAEVCPMELLPQQLFWYARAEEFDKAEHLNLFDCIECGACSYVCPSAIPLVQYYRYAKGEIRQQRAEQLKADRARERFEARQARLQREQEEKELKRQERARAAAEAQARKARESAAATATSSAGAEADQRAAKAAMVEQALARKKARAEVNASEPKPPASTPAPDIDSLRTQLEQAQAKLANMESMLADARSNDTDTADKLERAVGKNKERVRRAEQNLAEALARTEVVPAPTEPASEPPVDLATLEKQRDQAQAKLDTMRGLLEQARAGGGGGDAEKLERAVAKNQDRLQRAEEALQAGRHQSPSSSDSASAGTERQE